MKKLLIDTCPNPLARAIWVRMEYKDKCVAVLNELPYTESVSGTLGPTQITVVLSKLVEKDEIAEMSTILRKITGPE